MENKKIIELRELSKQLAMAANNIDKLLDVVEAAKETAEMYSAAWKSIGRKNATCGPNAMQKLYAALAALESAE